MLRRIGGCQNRKDLIQSEDDAAVWDFGGTIGVGMADDPVAAGNLGYGRRDTQHLEQFRPVSLAVCFGDCNDAAVPLVDWEGVDAFSKKANGFHGLFSLFGIVFHFLPVMDFSRGFSPSRIASLATWFREILKNERSARFRSGSRLRSSSLIVFALSHLVDIIHC